MTHLYFDTSALVKQYRVEAGSPYVNALMADAANIIYISDLAVVELTSALTQYKRMGQIDVGAIQRALTQFKLDAAQRYVLIHFPLNWIKQACHQIEHYDLRALDAIHLAVALSLNLPSLTVVCADEKLLNAAAKAGLSVLNPLT